MAVDHTKPAPADGAPPASAGTPAGKQGAGKQGAAEQGAAEQGTADPEADATPDLDETKRKFREALDRKRGTHASANAEGAQDTGKVHGSHGPAASRRSFRRKSGS